MLQLISRPVSLETNSRGDRKLSSSMMAKAFILSYSLLHFTLSAAFVPSPTHLASTTPTNSRRSILGDNGGGPLFNQAQNGSPIVVVGNIHEALAAAMALCARDVLLNNQVEERSSPIPPAQNVAFFSKNPESDGGSDRAQQQRPPSSETISSLQNALLFLGPSMNEYEQILAHALQLMSRISPNVGSSPMLYTSIDFGCEQGSKAMQSLSMTRNRFSFLGLNLNTNNLLERGNDDDGGFLFSRESADEWGNKLHYLLEGDQLSAAVTMDVRTHLAMLQANSLPRSRGVLGEKDVWAIKDNIQDGLHIDNGDGMLLEYEYDYSDPFGGCDPLLRPSTGYVVQSMTSGSSSTEIQCKANDAYAAAYSAMVGSGMDHLSSICIATSVKAVFRELGKIDDGDIFSPPLYSWNVIDHIVSYTVDARQNVRLEDGLPRRMYKDFGYR